MLAIKKKDCIKLNICSAKGIIKKEKSNGPKKKKKNQTTVSSLYLSVTFFRNKVT